MQVEVQAKGLLFDMDGVLISSIGSVERCWKRWAKMYDVPDADNYHVPHGVRAIDIIKSLRPDIDAIEGLRVVEDMEIEDTADLKVLPGVKTLLEGLPKDRWAIVTSATKRLAIARLEIVGLPVPERFITADMVEKGKPDPEPYMRGAGLLGFSNAECVVVEDAPSGVGAGKAAGSRVLGVIGTHTLADLHQADWVVSSLEGLVVTSSGEGLQLQFPSAR
ncbi:MAG: HAD-IA family hydrolase [Edaphobacter sp.]|uniref:HAD-IA family hydrolase n=1 Tax=Edaphobacter sp. TaxID=1934404 RepID=UPI002382F561|nr:HAD-IA family hydrolase [Edaphobacter sp.]MDE1177833.1 HAD-IA family hydrolase [Edaphobacter sp.]